MARAIAKTNTATTTTTTKSAPADNYINLYWKANNAKSHYFTIDDSPEIVAKCRKDPDFANRLYGNTHFTAVYNERGVKKGIEVDLDSI